MKKQVAPSILSADFGALRQQIRTVVEAGADLIHVDCMDNHFVPNLTIGPVVLESLKGEFSIPFDVHLMVDDPTSLIKPFIEAGATMVSVHVEVDKHLQRTLELIRSYGAQAGLVLNPATPLLLAQEVLPWTDYLLLMTVNPGFAAQSFIQPLLAKIEQARAMIDQSGFDISLQVDGGVKRDNCTDIVKAGADILVVGSAIFAAPNPAAEVHYFKSILQNAAKTSTH